MEIKNLGQLLQHLATKAGVLATDPNLVNILSNAELTKVTLHSDLVKALDENLLSVEVAGDNHPVIGPKYRAQALNTLDKKMEAIIEELGLDDNDKTELKGIKSSYERFEKLTGKLKELSAKKEGADNNKDKSALQKQIDDLLKKMQDEENTYKQKLAGVENERTRDRINFELRSHYGTTKTIYDQLDADVKTASIDAVINKALLEKDAEFKYDEKGNLTVLKKDGSNLLGAGHTKYTPQTLIDEILAQNKILVVANQQQNNNQNNGQNNGGSANTVGAQNGQQVDGTNQSVSNLNMAALKSFNEATTSQ